MTKKKKLIAAALLCITGLFGEQAFEIAKNVELDWGGPNTPDVVIVDPTPEYQAMVKPLVAIDFSKEHRHAISGYFAEVASVVEGDPGFVKTTGQFREYNVMAGQLHFTGLGLKAVYPGLGNMVDASIIQAIGKENSALSQEKRDSLVAVLRAIAWSVNQ